MKRLLSLAIAALLSFQAAAQDHQLTRAEILAMSTDELAELPLDQLMQAVETLGVSSVDELFALIMNKNVSSASKAEENSFTSPLSSTVITRDELRTYGVTTIEEAFRLVPGMIVAEKANGVYDVHMRGLANIPDNNVLYYTECANVLVMVDGRPVHNYATGTTTFETLPIGIEDVERIEVVRGATSALYGANAVNGVINIITEKPDNATNVAKGSVQIGNNTTVADFALRKKVNDVFALGLTGNYQMRYRPTDKFYLIPQANYYVLNNEELFANGTTLSKEQYAEALSTGKIMDISGGADLTVSQVGQLYKLNGVSDDGNYYSFIDYNNPINDLSQFWPDPKLSRRTTGVNGYMAFTPSENLRIDVQGGFNYSMYVTTPVGNDDVSLRTRKYKGGYANLDVHLYGLKLQASYIGGPIDMCLGTHAFSMSETHNVNAQAEYDFKVGPVNIVPGVSLVYAKYVDVDPHYYDYGYGPVELSGYWGYGTLGNNYAETQDIAPSLRVDFKHEGLRLVAAVRSDKTDKPDKWNTSWQFAASYQVNDNNFVRAVYGRSFRAASLVNTASDYSWVRPSGATPAQVRFVGNENAPILHIDNVEVGYRVKPTSALLIDAEAFYSRSTDYGEIKSYTSNITLNGSAMQQVLQSFMGGTLDMTKVPQIVSGAMSTVSQLRYEDMPFVVHQFGIGLNIDWIISPKVVAKLNANIQRTTIDNYYQYSQNEMITRQLMRSQAAMSDGKTGVMALIQQVSAEAAASGDPVGYMQDCLGFTPVQAAKAQYDLMDEAGKEQYLQSLLDAYNGGPAVEGVERPLGLYYALKYDIRYDRTTNNYYLATSVDEPYTTEDNYRHKAMPSVYGMVGVICKPTSQWNISAFANLLGKREYTTVFGTETLDPRCTVNLKVSYKPVDVCEFFIAAHNLFNTEEREFVYTDKIGGSYTVGVSFGL